MAGAAKDLSYEEALAREPYLLPTDDRPSLDSASSLDTADVDELIKELTSVSRHLGSRHSPSEAADVSRFAKSAYLTLGCLCVSLGTIGIIVPGLPTTIFMIVALWAFTKSSPQMRAWLIEHKHFGPALQHWVKHRSIPTRARQIALASLLGSALFIGYTVSSLACLAFILFVCAPVASYLWTLPANPEN